MTLCKICLIEKNEVEFPKHRFGISSTCKVCTKSLPTASHKKPMKKFVPKPEGSIHKRCTECKAHVFVLATEEYMDCWKCGQKFKIVKAIRDSTLHRGGIILRVIP